jgi:NAD-dependent deacetylase
MDPAARMCAVALQAGAQLVIVNADRTPYDNAAAVILRGRIGETLPSIVGSSRTRRSRSRRGGAELA